jgi:Mg2+ and Co2+ transporter CorA
MNVPLPSQGESGVFAIGGLSLTAVGIAVLMMKWKKLF